MKFARITAIFLILLMVVTPAMASACALLCLNGEASHSAQTNSMDAMNSASSMDGMEHCAHHEQQNMGQHALAHANSADPMHQQAQHHQFDLAQPAQQNDSIPDTAPSQHHHCTMAGCHLVSATAIEFTASAHSLDLANTALPRYSPAAFSADLLPPIKPPA